jgi:hypothetical protein
MRNQPIFLTEKPKKVLNRDTYSTSPIMGLNKISSALAAVSLAAAPALAQDREQTGSASEAVQPAASGKLTLEACAIEPTQEAILSCLAQLEVQQKAEIAALDVSEKALDAENAASQGQIETVQAENAATQARIDQGNTTNVVLRERVEGLEQLRDIVREEADRDEPSR